MLREYQSVWPNIWPQNKCRSLWPIFHFPVILPYILKSIWCMNIILWNYETVWQDIWPKINVGHCDLYFLVQWFYLVSWRLFDIIYEHHTIGLWVSMTRCLTSKYLLDTDLYFMVQWFCLISWKLFSGWTSYLGIMSQYDPTFDLEINVGHCDLYLIDECHTSGKWVNVIRHLTSK